MKEKKKKLILIIDDDPDILESLKAGIEAGGYSVVSAMNGTDALSAYDSTSPDFVLCDIMMEKVDTGIRVADEIRKRNSDVPVYLLSDIGKITSANIDIYARGFNGSLQKPVNPDEVNRLIRNTLG